MTSHLKPTDKQLKKMITKRPKQSLLKKTKSIMKQLLKVQGIEIETASKDKNILSLQHTTAFVNSYSINECADDDSSPTNNNSLRRVNIK